MKFCNGCDNFYVSAQQADGTREIFCKIFNGGFKRIGKFAFGNDLLISDWRKSVVANPTAGVPLEVFQVIIELNGLPLPVPEWCNRNDLPQA